MAATDPIAELYERACEACPELHQQDHHNRDTLGVVGDRWYYYGNPITRPDAHDLIAGRCLRVLGATESSIAQVASDKWSVIVVTPEGEYHLMGCNSAEALLRAVIAVHGGDK